MTESAPNTSEKLAALTWEDVRKAASLDLFSTRDGKQVDLARLQDEDFQFIRRTHTEDSLKEIEQFGLSYAQAWSTFQEMCEKAELVVVPSKVIENPSEWYGQVMVASEIIYPTAPLEEAPLDLKVQLARSLMNLFYASKRVTPSTKILYEHNFLVENDRVVLVDIDPYLTPSSPISQVMDERAANYLRALAKFMEKICPEPEDYQKTTRAILAGTLPHLDKYGPLSHTDLALVDIIAMSKCID